MSDFRLRLEEFLTRTNQPPLIRQLTPDASTREYFRVKWNDGDAIACVYPEPFSAAEQTYLDATNLFLVSSLPVAKVYDFDENLGVIIQEDFGDRILRPVLDESDKNRRETLLNEAITLIAKIQAATEKAFTLDSIASRLNFDAEKLNWELNYFKTHFFETYLGKPLSRQENDDLSAEFAALSAELESHAKVLCHRDFHAFNLMLDGDDRMRIIDHQDARIGAASYDLVSLLLDRVLAIPEPGEIVERQHYFLEQRRNLGLENIDFADFADEFRLQTVQRCLKAVGTFSFQTAMRGKIYFKPYIQPTLKIALQAAHELDKFPNIQKIIEKQISI